MSKEKLSPPGVRERFGDLMLKGGLVVGVIGLLTSPDLAFKGFGVALLGYLLRQ